jgi:enoyl-[acyl-carrier protein] reductase II
MRTRLTDILDIEHPVMLAGMGGVSYSDLVVAVSEAGGFGCLGASTMSDAELDAEMADVRSRTDKPYGVDLLTAAGDQTAKVERIIAAGATLYVAGLGVPREVVDLCHAKGVLVMNMCGKVRHAVDAVAAGCDIVVAQGTEAGGHTGRIATNTLVPLIVDAVGDRVPVVAAGGIYDGRGLASALTLGADGIWVGTRFIATPEAHTVDGYKEKLVSMAEDDTIVTRAYTGKTCRVVRTSYAEEFEAAGGQPEPFPMQVFKSMEDGANHLGAEGSPEGLDIDREFMPAGQGAGGIEDLVPAAELVERFVAEAEEALARAQGALSA